MEKLKCNILSVFAHLETATRSATVAYVLEIRKDPYFYNRPLTLPSSVAMTVVRSVSLEGGTNVGLKEFN